MPRIQSTLPRDYQRFSNLPLEVREALIQDWKEFEHSVETGQHHAATMRALADDQRKHGKSRINTSTPVRAKIVIIS